MVEINIEYAGGLRCSAVHGPSKASLHTDAPVDNHGKGESFSPTDLVATALGTCMTTLMGIRAADMNLVLDGFQVRVVKHMSAAPRRIAKLEVVLTAPEGLETNEDQRRRLEHAAETCPVRLSLLDAMEVPTTFHWSSK